jgi:hypothetical protein
MNAGTPHKSAPGRKASTDSAGFTSIRLSNFRSSSLILYHQT